MGSAKDRRKPTTIWWDPDTFLLQVDANPDNAPIKGWSNDAGGTDLFSDGTVASPSVGFASESSSGLYRIASGILGMAILGVERLRLSATELLVSNSVSILGPRPWADVVAYGAVGDDATDNSTALANALASSAFTINVPDGTYRFNTPLTMLRHKRLLLSSGAVLKYTATSGTAITINGVGAVPFNSVPGGIEGGTIYGSGGTAIGVVIGGTTPSGGQNSFINNCSVSNFATAVKLGDYAWVVSFYKTALTGNTTGFLVSTPTASGAPVTFTECWLTANTNNLDWTNVAGTGVTFVNCTLDGGRLLFAGGASQLSIVGGHILGHAANSTLIDIGFDSSFSMDGTVLEFPVGTPLYTTAIACNSPRIVKMTGTTWVLSNGAGQITNGITVSGTVSSIRKVTILSNSMSGVTTPVNITATIAGSMLHDGVAGSVANADGAVGAPAWTFALDPDTGMYRIGANDLGFATNGVKQFELTTALASFTQPVAIGANVAATGSLRLPTASWVVGRNAANSGDINLIRVGTGDTIDIGSVLNYSAGVGIALGGGAAPTLGTIGGSGPTVAGQNKWCQIQIAGTTYWFPVWV